MPELDELITTRALIARPGEKYMTLTRIDRRLESYQKLVGGDIEHLALDPEINAYINEDGKALELPVNYLAHLLVIGLLRDNGRGLHDGDRIVGPVIFIGPPNSAGWDTDVPDSLITGLRDAGVEIREEA